MDKLIGNALGKNSASKQAILLTYTQHEKKLITSCH
jgi:hypothetical protein